MFLFGFLLALAWWGVKRFGPTIRSWVKDHASPAVYKPLDAVIFTPLSWLKNVHPALVLFGFLSWAPTNLTYYTVGLYFSLFFMYYLRRYKTAWWEKYNYVLAAGLNAGLAFSAIIMFFAVQYHDKSISWWGNDVLAEGVDGGSSDRTALKMDLPEKGYYGPDEWW
ncbi:unnamed protein product [Ambrosiozyma monospora]|uniref:Unnamed protein product n=1 Tax=Ambrosiozyma monospora TaxID=43982 RepID=A0ACB5SSW7_AMBMO|nr:unnamed protein product [Ambrosiozyma monospora]